PSRSASRQGRPSPLTVPATASNSTGKPSTPSVPSEPSRTGVIPTRPRRSVLFMPAANLRAMEKAKALPADAVVFDLEDAVAPDMKEQTRANAIATVRAGGYGRREVIVRVNALSTAWGPADLAGVATSGADAVLLPKVESADTVRNAMKVLETH